MGNTSMTIKKYAHLVNEVQPNSPGARCGLRAKEDYVIKVAGQVLMYLSASDMQQLVMNSEEKELELIVYNSMSNSVRTLQLRPSRNWPGEGLLGITLVLAPYNGYKKVVKPLVKGVPNTFQGDPAENAISVHDAMKENRLKQSFASDVNPLFRRASEHRINS